MTDRIATSLADIEAAVWDRAGCSSSVYLTHAWLCSVEGRISPTQFYLLSGPDSRPSGRLSCYLLPEPAGNYATFDPVETLLVADSRARVTGYGAEGDADAYDAALAEVARNRATLYPALVCAVPNGYLAGIDRARTGGPDPDRADPDRADPDGAVLTHLLDRFEALARSVGARTAAVLYVPDGDLALARQLRVRGYAEAVAGANSVLEVPAGTFEDYLGGLRGIRARKEVERFRGYGLTVEICDSSVLDERLAELQLQHYRQYGLRGSLDHVLRSFRETRRHLGDLLRVIRVHRRETIVGFHSGFRYGRGLFSRYGAFDRNLLGRETFAHFNLQYYEMVRLAQAEGVREIHYGLGSYPTKVRRGCRLDVLRTFVRPMAAGPATSAFATCWRLLGRANEREIAAVTGGVQHDA
ncbi:GNAT family N-acetyltransferase [Plantactinospora sp. BB1]|uniref:GNAT family N-acetyltransferase n=1 Tax=Plantactinospora sp. BB1 TaxID=2071627 RepID=UPI000D16A8DD|nr:GNAT family N-acetyltransferase [Plantactinospora sp. BB1]AVT38629.1 hypothetical protein C6W10_21760 [Plantactinospora sp. BB1]